MSIHDIVWPEELLVALIAFRRAHALDVAAMERIIKAINKFRSDAILAPPAAAKIVECDHAVGLTIYGIPTDGDTVTVQGKTFRFVEVKPPADAPARYEPKVWNGRAWVPATPAELAAAGLASESTPPAVDEAGEHEKACRAWVMDNDRDEDHRYAYVAGWLARARLAAKGGAE